MMTTDPEPNLQAIKAKADELMRQAGSNALSRVRLGYSMKRAVLEKRPGCPATLLPLADLLFAYAQKGEAQPGHRDAVAAIIYLLHTADLRSDTDMARGLRDDLLLLDHVAAELGIRPVPVPEVQAPAAVPAPSAVVLTNVPVAVARPVVASSLSSAETSAIPAELKAGSQSSLGTPLAPASGIVGDSELASLLPLLQTNKAREGIQQKATTLRRLTADPSATRREIENLVKDGSPSALVTAACQAHLLARADTTRRSLAEERYREARAGLEKIGNRKGLEELDVRVGKALPPVKPSPRPAFPGATAAAAAESAAAERYLYAARQFYAVGDKARAVQEFVRHIEKEGSRAAVEIAPELLLVADEVGNTELRTRIEDECIRVVSTVLGTTGVQTPGDLPLVSTATAVAAAVYTSGAPMAGLGMVAAADAGAKAAQAQVSKLEDADRERVQMKSAQNELRGVALEPAARALLRRGYREEGLRLARQALELKESAGEWLEAHEMAHELGLDAEASAYRLIIEKVL